MILDTWSILDETIPSDFPTEAPQGSNTWGMVKVVAFLLGMVIPPLIGILIMGI